MRLTPAQQDVIHQATRLNFGEDAKVWLFGSRVDDSRRGGDVDLYIETKHITNILSSVCCKIAIEDAIDLRVDLIVNDQAKNQPIYQIAKNHGVQL